MFLHLFMIIFFSFYNLFIVASPINEGQDGPEQPVEQHLNNENSQKQTQQVHGERANQQKSAEDKPELKSKSAKFAADLKIKPAEVPRSMSSNASKTNPTNVASPGVPEGYIGTLRVDGLAPIVIRRARPADVDEIITFAQPAYTRDPLRADLIAGSNLKDVKMTEYNHCKSMMLSLFDGSRVILVSEIRDRTGRKRLISCFQLYRQSPTAAYFGMFAVHPFFQKTGLGKRLLTVAERYARIVWGSDELHLDVGGSLDELKAGMGRLQRYYDRRGFRSTGILRPFHGAVARFITVDRNDLWIEQMVKDIRGVADDIIRDQTKRMVRVNSRGRLVTREADKSDESKGKVDESEEEKKKTKEQQNLPSTERQKDKKHLEDDQQALIDFDSYILLEKYRL